MRRIILSIVLVLVGMYIIPVRSWADDRQIALRAKTEQGSLRTVFPVSAWIDSRTVSVSFMEKPDEATVVITNVESGESVTESYAVPETVAIPLELSAGSCEIEIYYDDKAFVGEFILE